MLPVFVSAVLVTFYTHYRRKKAAEKNGKQTEDEFMQASPEQVGYTKGDGEYILFDHSQLIQEYKDRLSSAHARFQALQHDFTGIETKYNALAMYTQTLLINNKKVTMENLQEQLPKHIQAEIHKLSQDHASEKKEWLARLEQLSRTNQILEQENRALHDQMRIQTVTDDEKGNIIQQWKDENISLRATIAGQKYVKDVLDENKAQLAFLQQQLEQRIKNQHEADQHKSQMATELELMKENNHFVFEQTEVLKNELQMKQDEVDKMQSVLCEKEEQLAEKDQSLASKQNQITYLDNLVRELKGQNEIVNASAADGKDQLNALQQQLSDERSRVEYLEQKLMTTRQTMRRLYKEFSAGMEDENEVSPVIALRPDYGASEELTAR